jgi:ABC-type branched-subunit amino acid transport system ATPase component
MDAAFRLADRLTVLVDGRVVAPGAPDDIRANVAVRQAFFDLAPLIHEEIWRCLTALKRAGQSILVIERGRLIWDRTSRGLAAAPDVQRQYLGI